jgi:hypothetical protein
VNPSPDPEVARVPSPYLLIAIQSTMGLVIFGLLSRHYVLPWLERQDFHAALAPVLLLHGLRFLGLSLLAPDQVAAGQDMDALTSIAFGDLAAAVTGVAAAAAAFRRSPLTVPLAWLFTVVGIGDLVLVSVLVNASGIVERGMGFMWATLGLLAPALVLSHVYVLRALLGNRAPAEVATSRAA